MFTFQPLLSFRGAILLALPELLNVLLNGLIDTALQLGAVSARKEDLKPDEKGRQEDSLDEIVQESRCPALELAVSNKLRYPAHNVDGTCPVIRSSSVGGSQMVRKGGGTKEDGSEDCSGDRLHEYI
jgi:hypothetical protein